MHQKRSNGDNRNNSWSRIDENVKPYEFTRHSIPPEIIEKEKSSERMKKVNELLKNLIIEDWEEEID
jgi:hypothetical protein